MLCDTVAKESKSIEDITPKEKATKPIKTADTSEKDRKHHHRTAKQTVSQPTIPSYVRKDFGVSGQGMQ